VKRLVIDPGHGGKYPGVVHNGIAEKEANLATALTLKHVLINELGAPFEIVLTRAVDGFTPFHRRTGIPGTLFFSVHYDIPNGASPIYHKKHDCLSCYVAQRLSRLTGRKHPVWSTSMAAHTGGRLYIDDAKYPAVLWEVAPIDMYQDSKEFRLKVVRPMAKALMEVMHELG